MQNNTLQRSSWEGWERKGGFSLLEVVLTIAILAAVALATTLLLVPVARQTRIGRETEVANLEARKVLEKFQALPFNSIVTTYPQGAQIPIAGLPSGKIAVSYVDPVADPLVIQADLTWQSPDLGAMQRTFNTIRTE
jgi:prepilin-type N-terminal cleavage/methylation domain-containing protein